MASAAEQLVSNLNFSAFSKAEELKKRIWFTLGALLVYRFGTYIPLPGINPEALAQAFQQHSQGVLGLFNMFAGGAVGRMAIFALGIMPYISASIIVQLMTSVVPSLEALKKEGDRAARSSISTRATVQCFSHSCRLTRFLLVFSRVTALLQIPDQCSWFHRSSRSLAVRCS